MTERRIIERQINERRITERRITERRITERRKLPNVEYYRTHLMVLSSENYDGLKLVSNCRYCSSVWALYILFFIFKGPASWISQKMFCHHYGSKISGNVGKNWHLYKYEFFNEVVDICSQWENKIVK